MALKLNIFSAAIARAPAIPDAKFSFWFFITKSEQENENFCFEWH